MTLTEQMFSALKQAREALDADPRIMPIPRKYAVLAQAWYEEKFGQVVREAIARAERGGR